MTTGDDLDERFLRFLKTEFLARGTRPQHMLSPVTNHKKVMEMFGLDLPAYRELVARHSQYVAAPTIEAPNGCLHIDPSIVKAVAELDSKKAAPTPATPPPNRLDQTKQFFFGKWWFVVLVIGFILLGVAVVFIGYMKTILEWFGVK